MRTNIDILDDFSEYLRVVRGYSSKTIDGYYIDLKCFFAFLISYFDWNVRLKVINVFFLSKVDEEVLYSFLAYLGSYKSNSSSTRKRKLAAVKAFFKWLFLKYDSVLAGIPNPALSLSYIEKTKRVPKYLELKDAIRIQSVFDESNSKHFIRNNTIMVLFLNCGLRLSELAGLDVSDICFEDRSFRVIGKGNRERVVFFNDRTLKQLKLYLATRNDDYVPLFLSSHNTRLSPRSIEYICDKAFRLANIDSFGFTTHSLRHTAATYIYSTTNDILVTKEFLGHSSIAATQVYTHVHSEVIKNAVESNPLNFFIPK